MRVARVYVAQPLAAGAEVTLDEAASEHLGKVLRVGVGQEVTAFDGSGPEWRAVVRGAARRGMTLGVIERRPDVAAIADGAPHVTLLQSLARGEKMDWIIQKCTELGVNRVAPIEAERSVLQLEGARAEKRLAHWRAVAINACEQSGRVLLPTVDAPARLESACAALPQTAARWLLEPQAPRTLAAAARALLAGAGTGRARVAGLGTIALLVGPEGGLSNTEYETARHFGFEPVRLGPRVLRTETAAVAAVTAVQLLLGDLDDGS